ncbi:hypothetical protein EP51_13900 [Rhodococcus opacus]|uniref:Uncharacterized protein n=1 Tax=Rhodococcus opacus TaxID=37919 RepID=A0A076EQE8_RHOOP|nr:hypothetical protein EP51_13900 [Rhodococcus opacus]
MTPPVDGFGLVTDKVTFSPFAEDFTVGGTTESAADATAGTPTASAAAIAAGMPPRRKRVRRRARSETVVMMSLRMNRALPTAP